MNTLKTIFLASLWMNGWVLASAKGTAPVEMTVLPLSPDGTENRAQISLQNVKPGAMEFQALFGSSKVASAIKGEPRPVNLWVVVDASPLCHAYKIDQYVANLIRGVRADFGKQSVVSVVGHTNQSLEIYANARTPSDLEETPVDCEGSGLSGGLEKAFQHLLKQGARGSLPIEAWVFTSGNVAISKETATQLKSRQVRLRYILYNPVLETEIQGLLDEVKRAMAPEPVLFQTRSSDADLNEFPERWFQVEFDTPPGGEGKRGAVTLRATSNHQELARKTLTLQFSSDLRGVWLRRVGRMGGFLALFLVLAWAGFKLVCFYRKPVCPSCKKWVKRPTKYCFFCRGSADAFLVGNEAPWNPKSKRENVFVLNSPETFVGSQSRCRIRLVTPARQPRRQLAKIKREKLSEHRTTYQLLVLQAIPEMPILVNGNFVQSQRYLGHGDRIQFGETIFTFVSETGEEER